MSHPSVAFAADIDVMIAGPVHHRLPRQSKLTGLTPFRDGDGLLRVGGRLANASIPFDQRHPIILPGESPLVRNLIRHQHLRLYHGTIQTTTQALREQFWILNGRNAIRSTIHKCVICFRQRGQILQQQMAALVPSRVNMARPFDHVSLDYCGPFEVKRFPGRCKTLIKAYVAIFICMATRAVHFEVVVGLTSDAFIDAYQRMAARRGHCKSITTDNATTFKGAKRNLEQVLEIYKQSATNREFATRGIEWRFIMPRAPSQGGSHEAAVKLFKHHMKRCVRSNTLSVEEFRSFTTRVEPCVNSRPLGVLRDEASDDLVLTPAHFLIHGPFENVAVDPPAEEKSSYSSQWRRLQFLHQNFWRRWQCDYVNSLANRHKWKRAEENLAVHDIVLLRDENTPPNQWRMARVIETHPGDDGLVRNVTLQRGKDQLKRAVQGLSRLPIENENNEVACRHDGSANDENEP